MMIADNQSTTQKLNESLQLLFKRLTILEERVSNLENPQLMYKPPQSKEYLKLDQALDDIYKKIDILGRYTGG